MSQLLADLLSRGTATLLGLFLAAAATLSLMRTVVIPRALRSWISDTVARCVILSFQGIAWLRRSYPRRDAVMAWVGPTTIMMQLVTWLLLYLVSYGLLIYGVSGQSMVDAMTQSGSSLFTLGFAAAHNEDQTVIDFVAGATGPIVIAMLIGFLPTIYSTYLSREGAVTMMSATGGEPTWGPELLARAAVSDDLGRLDGIFRTWQEWAARLRMTHVTYPVLVWVRSARPTRHYVVSLLAVLDAAALHLALTRKQPRHEAYNMLLQGGQAFDVLYIFLFARRPWRDGQAFTGRLEVSRETLEETTHLPEQDRFLLAAQMAATLDSAHGLDREAVTALEEGVDRPLSVERADFDSAVAMLTRAGYPIETDLDLAWEEFRIARRRYEFAALSIARALDATPAPWSGTRRLPTPTLWPSLVVDVLPRVQPGHLADRERDADPGAAPPPGEESEGPAAS